MIAKNAENHVKNKRLGLTWYYTYCVLIAILTLLDFRNFIINLRIMNATLAIYLLVDICFIQSIVGLILFKIWGHIFNIITSLYICCIFAFISLTLTMRYHTGLLNTVDYIGTFTVSLLVSIAIWFIPNYIYFKKRLTTENNHIQILNKSKATGFVKEIFYLDLKCNYCGEELNKENDNIALCKECASVYHEDCIRSNKGCINGCNHKSIIVNKKY